MPMTIHGRAIARVPDEPSRAAFSRASYEPAIFADEPAHVPHYWQRALAGLADVDLHAGGALVSAFELAGEDWRRWPELVGWPVLALWDDADGVVHSRTMTAGEYRAWRAAHDGTD